jgi:hypothetical protein
MCPEPDLNSVYIVPLEHKLDRRMDRNGYLTFGGEALIVGAA